MNRSRRGFVSSLGVIIAGASAGSALEEISWAVPPAQQHEEHSKLPMTTHASGKFGRHACRVRAGLGEAAGRESAIRAGKPLPET